MFHGNTLISIFRGVTTDLFGDTADDNTTPSVQGVRASIIEQTQRVFVPADGVDRLVRFTRGRLPSNTIILEGDRVYDERADVMYVVEAVINPGSPYSDGDVRVDLKHVT